MYQSDNWDMLYSGFSESSWGSTLHQQWEHWQSSPHQHSVKHHIKERCGLPWHATRPYKPVWSPSYLSQAWVATLCSPEFNFWAPWCHLLSFVPAPFDAGIERLGTSRKVLVQSSLLHTLGLGLNPRNLNVWWDILTSSVTLNGLNGYFSRQNCTKPWWPFKTG